MTAPRHAKDTCTELRRAHVAAQDLVERHMLNVAPSREELNALLVDRIIRIAAVHASLTTVALSHNTGRADDARPAEATS